MGIILIALGVTFTTSLQEYTGITGIVFIAVGGLLFIIAMSKKRKQAEKKQD
jgi:hypothetical protein